MVERLNASRVGILVGIFDLVATLVAAVTGGRFSLALWLSVAADAFLLAAFFWGAGTVGDPFVILLRFAAGVSLGDVIDVFSELFDFGVLLRDVEREAVGLVSLVCLMSRRLLFNTFVTVEFSYVMKYEKNGLEMLCGIIYTET